MFIWSPCNKILTTFFSRLFVTNVEKKCFLPQILSLNKIRIVIIIQEGEQILKIYVILH